MGQAQARSTEASSKGYHFSATRPRPAERQDGGHGGAQDGVIASAFGSRRPPLVRIACTSCLLQNGRCWLPFRSIFGKRTRASIYRDSHHSRGHIIWISPRDNRDGAIPLQAHHHKNTPHEAVLPLYCSSSAPEAIHHTTHCIRVLHHNGGPNQYKPCVPCVVHRVA